MLKRQIKGILFDLDGTLVDSLATTFEAFNHSFVLGGAPPLSPPEIMKFFGPGEGEMFSKILGPERAETAYQNFRDYLDEHLHRVPLHAGIRELLDQIQSEGIPMSIVTGRSWNTTEVILKHHQILDRFVTVVANDHVGSPKPSPEGIELAVSRMNLAPAETIYVGDSWMDMRAARSAGALGAAAMWDLLADRNQIAPHTPDHYLDHPGELSQLIFGV